MDIVDRLAIPGDKRILLVVLDGLGGVPRDNKTELEAAWIPNLDRLAARSSLGLSIPIQIGITPGSGPAHLALFGYDPLEYEVGRGVLEVLGLGLELRPGDLCCRANFATIDESGVVTDRRAGRIPTERCADLCRQLQDSIPSVEDVEVIVRPGKEHRFAVVFRGAGLEDGVTDSDPLRVGRKPEEVIALRTEAEKSARVAGEFVRRSNEILRDKPPASGILLRGLARRPDIPSMGERFRLNPACIAAYPMYRGVARLVGMQLIETGESWQDEVQALEQARASGYDFFYLHFKETDKAGEDGDFDAKVELIERFDEQVLPRIIDMEFDVLCITGDHSTPAIMGGHSWHSVPFLIYSRLVRPQVRIEEFGERACARGNLGYLHARQAMGLMLAHAGRMRKYGA